MLHNLHFSRACAAMMVVYFHIAHHFEGFYQFGSFGVDIFFVISGYLMAKIVTESPRRFFLKRVVRVAPLYWGATLVVFFAAVTYPHLFKSTNANWFDLFRSLFFIPYTSPSGQIKPIYFIGWTLNYEMYFYVISAFSLQLFGSSRAWIGMVLFVTLFWALGFLVDRGALAEFVSYTIVFEFLLGVFVYRFLRHYSLGALNNATLVLLTVLAFLALVLFDVMAYLESPIVLEPRVLVLGLPAALLVLFLLVLEQNKFVIMRWPVLGDASYAIYLVHPILIEGAYAVLAAYAGVLGYWLPFGLFLACAIAGIFVHFLIEKPMSFYVKKALSI